MEGETEGRMARSADRAAEPSIGYGPLPGYVGYQLRRAQARLFAEFAAALGDLDLTPGAFGLLVLVRENPGITQMELGNAFGIDKSTLTPVLNRLEKRGLIRRRVLKRDRRFNAISLDPAKGPWLEDAFARLEAFEQAMVARLGPADTAALLRILGRLQAGEPTRAEDQREAG